MTRIWLLILAATSIMVGGCGTHWHRYSPYHWHLKLPCTSVKENSVFTTDQPESAHHPTIETIPLVEEGPILNTPGHRSLVVPGLEPQRTSPTSHGDPLHRSVTRLWTCLLQRPGPTSSKSGWSPKRAQAIPEFPEVGS